MVSKKLLFIFLLVLNYSLYAGDADKNFVPINGWQISGEVLSFNSENLWEYINGAADQFIEYGFHRLQTCDLKQKDCAVTIEVYQMTSTLNAFGIYSAECPANSERLAVGGEGVVLPPGQILMFKDIFYVKIYAYEGEINPANGIALLESLAESLPGENGMPGQLKMLPQENKLPGSEGYTAMNHLGLSELSRCLFADYRGSDSDYYQLFCVLPDSNESIRTKWKRLKADKWQSIEDKNDSYLYRQVPYKGYIGVRLKNDCILGVSYTDEKDGIVDKLKNH